MEKEEENSTRSFDFEREHSEYLHAEFHGREYALTLLVRTGKEDGEGKGEDAAPTLLAVHPPWSVADLRGDADALRLRPMTAYNLMVSASQVRQSI